MPNNASAEIGAATVKAALERGGKSDVGAARPKTRVETLAQEARKKMDKPRSVLEDYRSRRPDKSTLSEEPARKLGTRDSEGKIVQSSSEQALASREQNARNLNRNFAEKGYTGLDLEGQKLAREKFAQVFAQNESMAALRDLDPARFDELVLEHLKDPAFLAEFRNHVNVGELSEVLDTAVLEATKKLAEKESALGKVDRQLKRLRDEELEDGNLLDQFKDRSGSGGGAVGEKYKQLQELTEQFPGLLDSEKRLGATAQEIETRLSVMRGNIGGLVNGNRVTEESYTALRREASEIDQKLAEVRASIAKKKGLEEERNSIIARRKTRETQIEDLDAQRETALSEKSMASTLHEEAVGKWQKHEQVYVSNLEGVFDGAADQYIEKSLIEADRHVKEAHQARIEQANSDAEKAIIAGLDAMFKPGPWRKEMVRGFLGSQKQMWRRGALPKDIIQIYADKFLQSGGNPAVIIRGALEKGVNPETGRGYLTADQVNELMENQEFLQSMSDAAVESLFKAKGEIGGFKVDEAAVLAETPWGARVISHNIDKNPTVMVGNKSIEQLKQEVGAKTNEDLLKKVDRKTLAALLLQLFGTIMLGGAKSFVGGLDLKASSQTA